MEKLTESRRSALREQGVFPYSKDFTNFFVFVGVSVAALIVHLDLSKDLTVLDFVLYSLAVPFGAGLGGMAATLFQSKFLIGFTAKRNLNQRRSSGGLSIIFFTLIKALIVLGAGVLLLKGVQEKALTGTGLSLQGLLSLGWQLTGGILFLFALLGLIIARLQFSMTHSMSKEEVQSESREGEMRPELRSATDRIMSGAE